MFLLQCLLLFNILKFATAFVHPIKIMGTHFYDSETEEPFFIKGVDYQPEGSSGFIGSSDPLSNPQVCARDIMLFQELGINTIRIYSINPDLDHSKCMTMLAMAGIYLMLDVNSPLPNQHINRYEPWTTYNPIYLEHVFKVVQEFSQYNNTLGFFAGNEIINDKKSSEVSPVYVKQLVTDIKNYISKNCERYIPVGYSAADDLRYRVSLSKYLECELPQDKTIKSVDFYGVNSYQWCGQQTLETSGYDELIKAYQNYSKPVFFSEYGCNKVLPRQFLEAEVLYTPIMAQVFSGGLVYEFTQESNNYGLIKIDSNGHAKILQDFEILKKRYKAIEDSLKAQNFQEDSITPPVCKDKYSNLGTNTDLPKNLAKSLIEKGVEASGGYCELENKDFESKYKVYGTDGALRDNSNSVKIVNPLYSGVTDSEPKGKEIKKSSSCNLRLPLKGAIRWLFALVAHFYILF
ncbi:similar to Saccharomyces cerevisiae YOL132W GAS4 1,3-beta-glucanosyltransferase, involved with Gas2p in spore wall assembly [Maudiozyma saulgeensis]|uniref:1,3-beta-glucanosyltransferase n=1 Tax=Maudiozyma saulgeensis TaxID=1789683 RepID=A0A1X7R9V6_9SACH|nr:similar to Saccharomyces cerevisiae YOL132W GAS4 1,3-beta-glucanosyltransferase, involved with Gas2p in spore wall assembly [Kazachstania saulgeensis]